MSRAPLWLQICIYYWVILGIYPFVIADDTVETGQLTVRQQSRNLRSLVFVSTLDGKISALDAGNHGQKQWTLDLNDGPMLSSNIHRRELNNDGQWVRLIPSLSGGLYKFDGEKLETIPISTDQLLHSSFRYSDDLVFSGGKEICSYGISANTGKILYECNISGCTNNTDGERYLEEVLVIKRFQQTVRAIEARTGAERWNFSVGQHNLMLIPPTNVYDKITLDIEIKVVIPEGLIWAVNKSNPTVKLWQYKFDSPIVSIWREDTSQTSAHQGFLEEISLFDGSQWVWGSEYSTIGPSLYVGMHERQLYVQENSKLKNSLDSSPKYIQRRRYPWQPHPAIGTAVISTLLDENDNDEVCIETNLAQSTTALSVLYNTEYINGNGFYLYSKDYLNGNQQCNHSNPDIMLITGVEKPMLTYTEEEDDTPVQVIIVSLWYWWKEVVIISITTAILLNFMLTQRLLNATTDTKDAVLPPLIVERHVETKKNGSANDDTENAKNFTSRYLEDFEPVDCLGKGGYGVVFEAKNKIDDCNYAIKRIVLPNSRDSRERVMREVKALAKLDHHNIVRYFNAWLECPPSEWQEEHDRQWINKQKFPPSEFPSEVTQTETKPNGSVCIDVSQTDPSSVDSAFEASELNRPETNDDLLIIFEDSSGTQHDNNAVCINAGNTESSNFFLTNEGIEEASFNIKDTNHSENIVFEASDNYVPEEIEKRKRQKSMFSLNLNNKSNGRKSTKMFLYIQMQLCQRLSLREWLKQQSSTRDPLRILNIFQQIVNAVEYVHLQGLIHRDLKPSNIFFALDDKIKVGDFGLVTAMIEGCDGTRTPGENENVTLKDDIHTARVGTHLYMPPEQMNGQVYNYKVDIYSLGIIFFELLTPFFTDMERIIALSNLKKSIFPKDFMECHLAEYNLLKMMLDEDPAKRPTTLGIKARPPLQNYETANGCNVNEDTKWHFELPQLTRHSSVTSSSSNSNPEWYVG